MPPDSQMLAHARLTHDLDRAGRTVLARDLWQRRRALPRTERQARLAELAQLQHRCGVLRLVLEWCTGG